jgi:hypothetical protein
MRLCNGRLWWALPVLLVLGVWALPARAQEPREREREERERAERRERREGEERERGERREGEERERAERREREGGGEVRELAAAVKQLREQMERMQRQMREMQEALRRGRGERPGREEPRERGERREGEHPEIAHRLDQIREQMRDLAALVRERPDSPQAAEARKKLGALREEQERLARALRGEGRERGERREGERPEMARRLAQMTAQIREHPDSPQARERLGALRKERERLEHALRERPGGGEMGEKVRGLRGRLSELAEAYRKSDNDEQREKLRKQFIGTARELFALEKRPLVERAEQLEKELRAVREELERHDRRTEEQLKGLLERTLRGREER